jgi:hypothetical protein
MLLGGFELLPPTLDGVLGTGERAEDRRHVGQIAQLEAHIARMTGRGRPNVGVAQRMRDRAVPAGALAEHAAAPGTANPKRCSIAGSISCRRKSSQAPVEAELMY